MCRPSPPSCPIKPPTEKKNNWKRRIKIFSEKSVGKNHTEYIQFPDLSYRLKLNILEKAILQFYSYNLIEKQELEIIRNKFEEFDINGDGLISYKELKRIFKIHGLSNSVKTIFNILDTDKSQTISYNEYIEALVNRRKMELEKNIKKCFDAIDVNKNKRLSINEMETLNLLAGGASNQKLFKDQFYEVSKGKNYVKNGNFRSRMRSFWRR